MLVLFNFGLVFKFKFGAFRLGLSFKLKVGALAADVAIAFSSAGFKKKWEPGAKYIFYFS